MNLFRSGLCQCKRGSFTLAGISHPCPRCGTAGRDAMRLRTARQRGFEWAEPLDRERRKNEQKRDGGVEGT